MASWARRLGSFVRTTGKTVRRSWEEFEVGGPPLETAIGRVLAARVEQEAPVDQDAAVVSRVEHIGVQLTACLKNKSRRFRFTVVAAAEANAFALPGGFIYVTRALLDLLERDEDELAFALGHEIGHVVRRHPWDRAVNSAAVKAALRTLRAGGAVAQVLPGIGAEAFTAAYGQDQEFEVDALGVRLARSAGFDPYGAVRLLERLRSLSGASRDGGLTSYFESHPPADDRIRRIRVQIESY